MLRPYQTFGQCGDQLTHSVNERAKSRRETRPASVDPQEGCGTALLQGLESLSRPTPRSAGQLRDHPIRDPQLRREGRQVRFGSQKPVGATLHEESIAPLGDDHPPRAPFALEDRDVRARSRQVPGGGESGNPGANDDNPAHVQPRVRAAVRATSATAAARYASSLRESVRSSSTPSCPASSRYSTSMSYRIST